jgi:8-oxo-dGTP diphosphatase
MSLAGQRLQRDRYKLIPRTLSFLLHKDKVLLMRVPEGRGAWAGLFNGIGGHVERGEDPLTAAKREIVEETGMNPGSLRLCGVAAIDTGDQLGIGLFVYVGRAENAEVPLSTVEGQAQWVAKESLGQTPLVGDLPEILPRALSAYSLGETFSARYSYDSEGSLHIHYGN